jgi:hypothetical protein
MLLDDLIGMLAGLWKYASFGYLMSNKKRGMSKDVSRQTNTQPGLYAFGTSLTGCQGR